MKLLTYVHLRKIHRSTGAGTVARALIEQFASQNNLDLRVLADRGDYDRIVHQVGEPWSSFNYHFFPHETSSQQAQWVFLNNPKAETFWNDVDLVFCAGESYVPTTKARLAVTIHDAAYFESYAHPRTPAYWTQQLKWRILYQRLISKADLFHAVSQFTAERLAHFFPAMKDRLRIVHNGVDENFFADPPIDDFTDPVFSQGPFILLPGGLHYRKNAELVFRAWPIIRAQRPDLRLLVVNHSNPSYLARAGALASSVVMLGYVEKEFLRALYTKAEIAWFPSRYEGFGLPVLEAMACRTPVVASDSSSLPEIAGGNAVLLPPSDPSAHADAILALLDSPSSRENMSVHGRRWAEEFRWEKSALKLRECFESVL